MTGIIQIRYANLDEVFPLLLFLVVYAGPEQWQKKWWGSLIFMIVCTKQNSWNLTSDVQLLVVPC